MIDAIGLRPLGQGLQAGKLRLLRCDNQFAATLVAHTMACAVIVKRLLARHAEPCLEAAGRIVDAGMDHLGVSGGCLGTDERRALQHQNLLPRKSQFTGDRQSYDPGPDDDSFHFLQDFPLVATLIWWLRPERPEIKADLRFFQRL